MIPRDYVTEWRRQAPWVQDFQVEQDLVMSRAIVDIFSHPFLNGALAFRGGTALYKLYLRPPARYSEDVDLVQVRAEPAGPMMRALHEVLNPWLGEPRTKQTEGRVTFLYRFESEDSPPIPLRLKVEINSREHFSVHGFTPLSFAVSSRWFEGTCKVTTYRLEELLGTKLRALYQRRKGRDLFDLGIALATSNVDPVRILDAFTEYMTRDGHPVTRAMFERNLNAKLRDPQFTADIQPLLAPGFTWDIDEMATSVSTRLIQELPGGPLERGGPKIDLEIYPAALDLAKEFGR